jgi:hypothetical protein
LLQFFPQVFFPEKIVSEIPKKPTFSPTQIEISSHELLLSIIFTVLVYFRNKRQFGKKVLGWVEILSKLSNKRSIGHQLHKVPDSSTAMYKNVW